MPLQGQAGGADRDKQRDRGRGGEGRGGGQGEKVFAGIYDGLGYPGIE